MAKKFKINPKFLFQHHIQVGSYPHIRYYSVSPFLYLSRDAARQAAEHKLILQGINPNKAKIHTNQRDMYFKSGMYSGFKAPVLKNKDMRLEEGARISINSEESTHHE